MVTQQLFIFPRRGMFKSTVKSMKNLFSLLQSALDEYVKQKWTR